MNVCSKSFKVYVWRLLKWKSDAKRGRKVQKVQKRSEGAEEIGRCRWVVKVYGRYSGRNDFTRFARICVLESSYKRCIYSILSFSIVFYSIWFYSIWFYSLHIVLNILFYILFHSVISSYCIVLYCILFYCIVLYCILFDVFYCI